MLSLLRVKIRVKPFVILSAWFFFSVPHYSHLQSNTYLPIRFVFLLAFCGFALHYAGENVTGIVGSQIAYCIEPDTSSTTGTTYNGTAAENSSYWRNKLSPAQRDAIRLILLYGAPNSLNSTNPNTLFGYEGATQMLIWEIVMGLRTVDGLQDLLLSCGTLASKSAEKSSN